MSQDTVKIRDDEQQPQPQPQPQPQAQTQPQQQRRPEADRPNRPMRSEYVEEAFQCSDDFGALVLALSKAQQVFENIEKTRTATIRAREGRTSYQYKYADLSDVMSSIRKPLAENGLVVVQFPQVVQGGVVVVTALMHSSGQWIRNTLRISGSVSTPQDVGILVAYARRYGVSALLALAAGVEDTDGRSRQEVEEDEERASSVSLSGVRKIDGKEGWIVRDENSNEYVTDDSELAKACQEACESGILCVMDWEQRQVPGTTKKFRYLTGMSKKGKR